MRSPPAWPLLTLNQNSLSYIYIYYISGRDPGGSGSREGGQREGRGGGGKGEAQGEAQGKAQGEAQEAGEAQ